MNPLVWKDFHSQILLVRFLTGQHQFQDHWWLLNTETPQMYWQPLQVIPIYNPVIEKDIEQKIETLVTTILAQKAADPKADTSELEKEIDVLVYELYGLTEEEIALIENC